MKTQIKIAAIAGILVFASCTKEATIEETANLTTSQSLNAKEQTPNTLFDNVKKGIYSGVIAAANTHDRGAIWINAENDGSYNAYAEMVGGEIINYTSERTFDAVNDRRIEFVAPNSSFVLDLSQNIATVTDVVLNNDLYFVQVAKATSTRMPVALTGTFNDPETPSLTGTWNILTTGTSSGGSFGEEELDRLMVTYDGMELVDDVFENFDLSACGESNDYPAGANADFVAAGGQTSDLGGAASWTVLKQPASYRDLGCNVITSGMFTYTDGSGTYDGFITID